MSVSKDFIKSVGKILPVKTDHYNATFLAPAQTSVSNEKSVPLYARPPWPEWTDEDVNKETWEENESTSVFEDITGNILPPSIRPVQWVRPSYFSISPKLIDWSQKTLDLVSPNVHLCEKSEAIRYMLSEISELFDHSKDHDFKSEGEDSTFVRNSLGSWNPWDHIYSLCKAGIKGEEPVYNPCGRYFVRLYYMGCWRRITVDDRIPILKSGLPGLPLGGTPGQSLWPLLLTKALLKISSLTADELHRIEIKDFSTISCLTGWTHEWHNITAPITSDDLWTDLTIILPKYKQSTPAYTHSHLGLGHSKKLLDDPAFWWLPPTPSSYNEQLGIEFDEFGEPIFTSAKAASPSKEDEAKNNKKSKSSKKKSITAITAEAEEEATSKIEEILKPASLEKKGKSKNKKNKKTDEAITDEEVMDKGKAKKKKKSPDSESESKTKKKEKKSKNQIGNEEDEENPKGKKSKKNEESKKDEYERIPSEKENQEGGNEEDEEQRKASTQEENMVEKTEKKTKKKKSQKGAKEEVEKPKEKKNYDADKNVSEGEEKPKEKKMKTEDGGNKEKEKGKRKKKKKSVEPDEKNEMEKVEAQNDVNGGDIKSANATEDEDEEKDTEKEDLKNGVKGKEKGGKKKKGDKKGNRGKFKKGTREEPNTETETEMSQGGSQTNTSGDTDFNNKGKKGEKKFKKRKRSKSNEGQGSSIDEAENTTQITKAELKEKLAKRAERIEKQKTLVGEKKSEIGIVPRQKLPSLQEILFGVQKYSGAIYQSLITTFEENCGKDLPVALTVIFKDFPKEKDLIDPAIPSFLYHPVQLYEVRDCPLAKRDDRPATPLWKSFRWKAWAMKKGIIPMEEDHFKDMIRSVKIHTPFGLKTDWYSISHHHHPVDYQEIYGETFEEDELEANLLIDEYGPEVIYPSPVSLVDIINSDMAKNIEVSKVSFVSGTGTVGKNSFEEEEVHGQLGVDFTKPGVKISNFLYTGEMLGETGTEDLQRAIVPILPNNACASMWFDIENLAPNLKQFCKFYSGRTTFGSCFTLRRSPRWVFETPIVKGFDDQPMKPIEISNFHCNPHSQNLTINFGESKTINIMSHHLDDLDGFDSGFYIFNDSWTEQEMIFDLEVLQLSALKKFIDTALDIDAIPVDPTLLGDISVLRKLDTPKVYITMILEPWDWRNDCCVEAPVVCGTTQTRWTTHVPLPPGRNTFRLWLIQDYPEINTSNFSSFRKLESVRRVMENHKKNQITQFSLKILSKTPVSVGTREEIQNYLTNEPVLLLKQCEALAHNIWNLLLSFGKSQIAYGRVLSSVRKSYCPAFTEPNKINKALKSVHRSFDECFVAMIMGMNNERMDNWMLLALRSLLLDPFVGQVSASSKTFSRGLKSNFDELIYGYKQEHKMGEVRNATVIIQKYFRRWRVRRLFQVRLKGHKYFPRLEYQICKITLILAKHTDSSFSVAMSKAKSQNPYSADERDLKPLSVPEIPFPPVLSLIPQPPKWAVNLLRLLIDIHPMLVAVHPHAYCVPLHVKIKDIEGTLPSFLKDTEWLPFCRQSICIPNEPKWTYCGFDLQVHPRDGIMVKVVDNETMQVLPSITNRLFLGRLPSNQLGYTIICYRWVNSSETRPDAYRRPPSKRWKLRLISPQIQKSIQLQDVSAAAEDEVTPRKLTLHRFTGYYIPNRELCICRYTMETRQLVTYLSLRFQASNQKAQLNLQITDMNRNTVVFQHGGIGSFLIPSVRIEGQPLEREHENNDEDFASAQTYQLLKSESTENSNLGLKYSGSTLRDSSETEEGIDGFYLHRRSSEPAIYVQFTPPQRFLISIYAKEDSWNLTDEEWRFTQEEKKKFWKRLIATKKAPRMPPGLLRRLKEKEENEKRKAEREAQQKLMEESLLAGVMHETVEPPPEEKGKITRTSSIRAGVGKGKKKGKGKDKDKDKDGASKDGAKGKDKGKIGKEISFSSANNSKKSKPHKEVKEEISKSAEQHERLKSIAFSQIKLQEPISPVPTLSPPSPPIVEEIPQKLEDVLDWEEYERDGYESANVSVEIGGPNSVKVKEVDQPHWLLEIVADTDQEIEFTSNLRMLNDKLERMKREWEAKQDEMLAAGLITRVHCVSESNAYMLADSFTLVHLLTDFELCLYIEESQMYKFTYGELLTPEEAQTKALQEKLAKEEEETQRRNLALRTSVNARVGKGKKGTRAPPPTPAFETHDGSAENYGTGDLFPTANAGSDFNFEKMDKQDYSIFPIDLSMGSPSFLELARKLAAQRESSFSSSTATNVTSAEMDGEDFDYQNALKWRAHMHRHHEYAGEDGEYYEDYNYVMEEFYGESEGRVCSPSLPHYRHPSTMNTLIRPRLLTNRNSAGVNKNSARAHDSSISRSREYSNSTGESQHSHSLPKAQ